MIKERIHLSSKQYHVTGGDARVFGQDADVRRKMTSKQVEERFAQVWEQLLEPEVRKAPIISLEEARELLDGKALEHAKPGYQYRQFSIDLAVFIARLSKEATEDGICDQLWPLGAHRDPTRLCLYFETIESKRQFEGIARQLKTEPRSLALWLVMDFVNKFPKT